MATTTDYDSDMDQAGGGVAEEDVADRVGLRYTFAQVRKDTTAKIGMSIVGFMTVLAILTTIDAMLLDFWFAETFWRHPQIAADGATTLEPPVFTGGTWKYPLGTDLRGRGILVRLVYGSRIAITVGFMSTAVGMVGGVLVGSVSGYYGGWIDDTLMRGAEILYAIPFLVLVIAFMAAFGESLIYAMVGVGIAQIPSFARLIRSRVVSVREEEYVEAAKAAGVRDSRVILRHVIPNSFAPVLVQATLQVGLAIIIVAGLSFLGFGVQPPNSSWGRMLASSRAVMLVDAWFSVWPGLTILVTVMGFNMFGDGLRDALDPRLQN